MNPDDKICYCFHIPKRKITSFLRVRQPRVASQLSECGSAGTGCGWCVPFLRKYFEEWREGRTDSADALTPEEYEARGARYIRSGGGVPPSGATPLPEP